MSHENVELTRRAIGHFNRGDRDALRGMSARSVEIVPLRAALEGTVYRGENAIAEFWAAVDETWETIRMDADEILDYGDRVLAIGRIRGRSRSADVEVDSPMAWITKIEDGKMVSIRTFTDIGEARRAAGRETS